MGLSLKGTTSGSIDLDAPAVAGNNTIVLPGSNGSANQVLKNSGTAGTLAYSTLTEDSSGNVNIAGVVTATSVSTSTLNVTGLSTFVGIVTTSTTLFADNINVAGVSSFTDSIQAGGVVKVDRTVSGDGCFHAALNGTVKASIASDGSASFASGDVIIDLNGAMAVAGPLTCSGAIKVGGTAAANQMDEYEEGSWTPVIKSATNVISQSGGDGNYRYVKVGTQVTVYFSMNNVTTSGSTGGDCTVTGLPFTSSSITNIRFISGDVMFYNSGFTLDAWPVYPHLSGGETLVSFYEKGSAGAGYNSAHVNTVGSTSFWFWTLTYITD
jgi:hypothetical protein